MKKVGIVSCDKWIGKIDEDNILKKVLNDFQIEADIISWQHTLEKRYDLLILRSVWGYQNYYNEFKKWLLYIEKNNIPLFNNPNLILNNILKDVQFEILKKNGIECIETYFLSQCDFNNENILVVLNELLQKNPCVLKPTISGSGENTFLVNYFGDDKINNTIGCAQIIEVYDSMLKNNPDCKIMFQPYISEINNGEYSCVFIDGELTHTMIRFPNVFHEKKRTYLINEVPETILELAKKVEKIYEFKDYLYMRVDMVIVNGIAKIMEVELAEPDFLTRYIDDINIKSSVMKTLVRSIERRMY